MIRRLFVMILLFAVTVCVCACGESAQTSTTVEQSESESNERPSAQTTTPVIESIPTTQTEPTSVATESTEPAKVSADNQEDYIPDGEVVAGVVDAVNETYTIDQIEHSRILPRIELPGPNVEAINEEILREYTSDYYSKNYTNIYYQWAVKDDVLSVVIIGGGSMNDGGWEGYGCDAFSVYNISISKCRLLSDEEVYAYSGVEDARASVLNAIVRYSAEWKGYTESRRELFFPAPDDYIGIISIAEELSEENFLRARPYFDDGGNLCVMGYAVTNIGAGGFFGFVPVYQYEAETLLSAEEYYSYYYELYRTEGTHE